jgi:hypothetical protein
LEDLCAIVPRGIVVKDIWAIVLCGVVCLDLGAGFPLAQLGCIIVFAFMGFTKFVLMKVGITGFNNFGF